MVQVLLSLCWPESFDSHIQQPQSVPVQLGPLAGPLAPGLLAKENQSA